MLERLNRMSHWRVMVFTFSLITAAFPVAISQAETIQVTKSLVYRAMIPLLDQLKSAYGDGAGVSATYNDGEITVTVDDEVYVFSNMQKGGEIGTATVTRFDSNGNYVGFSNLSVSVPDSNGIVWDIDGDFTGEQFNANGYMLGAQGKQANMMLGDMYLPGANLASVAQTGSTYELE